MSTKYVQKAHTSKWRNTDTEQTHIILQREKSNRNVCDTGIFSWHTLEQDGLKIYASSDLVWHESSERLMANYPWLSSKMPGMSPLEFLYSYSLLKCNAHWREHIMSYYQPTSERKWLKLPIKAKESEALSEKEHFWCEDYVWIQGKLKLKI